MSEQEAQVPDQVEGEPVVEVQEATDPLTPEEVREQAPLDRFKTGKLGMIAGFRSLVPELRKTPSLNFDVMPMPTLDAATRAAEAGTGANDDPIATERLDDHRIVGRQDGKELVPDARAAKPRRRWARCSSTTAG